MTQEKPQGQWRRNPVAWLMILIPAATVVAGFWTLWLAASESGVDSNPDTVRRTAQIQVSSLEPDENASRLGLRGRVIIEAGSVLVVVTPSAGTIAPQLQLVHPIEDSLDRAINLRVVAADASWRVVGRYYPGDTEVQLEPAVSSQ